MVCSRLSYAPILIEAARLCPSAHHFMVPPKNSLPDEKSFLSFALLPVESEFADLGETMARISSWTSLGVLLLGCSLPTLAQQSAANTSVPTGTVQGQTTTFKAYVPFSFMVGNRTLPSGTYRVQRLLGHPGAADEVGLIVLRSADHSVYAPVVTLLGPQTAGSNSHSQLVFASRSGQHRLSEVLIGGETAHRIPAASGDSELANSDAPRVEVALADLR